MIVWIVIVMMQYQIVQADSTNLSQSRMVFSLWAMVSTVQLVKHLTIVSCTRASVSGSIEAVASSSMSIFVCFSRALARQISCFWPTLQNIQAVHRLRSYTARQHWLCCKQLHRAMFMWLDAKWCLGPERYGGYTGRHLYNICSASMDIVNKERCRDCHCSYTWLLWLRNHQLEMN